WLDLQPEIARSQAAWETTAGDVKAVTWTPTQHLIGHFKLDGNAVNEIGRTTGTFEDGQPAYGPGRIDQGAEFDGKRFINAGNIGEFGFLDKFTLAAWIYPRGGKEGYLLS